MLALTVMTASNLPHTVQIGRSDGTSMTLGTGHLGALQSIQDAIIETLTNIAPEGGIWTLERLAMQVGAAEGYKSMIFEIAIDAMAASDQIITDGEDVILA